MNLLSNLMHFTYTPQRWHSSLFQIFAILAITVGNLALLALYIVVVWRLVMWGLGVSL